MKNPLSTSSFSGLQDSNGHRLGPEEFSFQNDRPNINLETGPSPLISIVIPTFNRPQLLIERALRSALAQDYSPLEVLVVTDGPDPLTEAALSAVHDSRLRALTLPYNAGPSAVRNFGVQEARGQWIAFLDDDDEWGPEKLTRQLECARQSSFSLPLVFSSWINRTPAGDTLNPPYLKGPTQTLGDYLLTRRSPKLPECSLTISMAFAPRSLLLLLPFAEDLRKHEDWDWMLKAEQVPGVGVEQLPLGDSPALAIYYHGEPRDFASRHTFWEPSLAWAESHRQADRLSDRAFAGFIVSQLAPFPAAAYDGRGFAALTRALASTRPGLYEWLRYFKLWAIPAPMRRSMKGYWRAAKRSLKSGKANYSTPLSKTPF